MLKATLTLVSILWCCCCGQQSDAPKGTSDQPASEKAKGIPPCTCLLFAVEPVDENNSLYYAEFHPSGTACALPEVVFPIHPNGLGDQLCDTEVANCIPGGGGEKVGELKGGHIGCIDPPTDWTPSSGGSVQILSNKILRFREKSGPWIRARIYLLEYNSSNPKLYRQVAVGKEITDEFDPGIVVDDTGPQGQNKLVKKVGPHCHYDVRVGSVTYRVLTRQR